MKNDVYEAKKYVQQNYPELYDTYVRLWEKYKFPPVWLFMKKHKGEWIVDIGYRMQMDVELWKLIKENETRD